MGRVSANFWSYSANLRTDSAEFGTFSADSPDDSAKPQFPTKPLKIKNHSGRKDGMVTRLLF
ncbi:hypothetical protein COE25_17930 [Bacillus sp. AFS031507]|nr:hypothetical protein COE25_17930 [Bacillus sp. AFS031507]